MTIDELRERYASKHDNMVDAVEQFVRSNGGCVRCDGKWYYRYNDELDPGSTSSYKFDHVYIDGDGQCIVVYSEDTDYGEINIEYLDMNEIYTLINSFAVKDDWQRYIAYLHEWAENHSDALYKGMTPVSFEEWCDNLDEIDREFKSLINCGVIVDVSFAGDSKIREE